MIKSLPAILVALSLALTGCVLHLGDDDWSPDSEVRNIKRDEAKARRYLAEVSLGTPVTAVVAELGTPDFTEAFRTGDDEARILRYRTHRAHSDGDTTRDETTPLVFVDGKLVGVGESAVTRLR